jgi:hypothetical protein
VEGYILRRIKGVEWFHWLIKGLVGEVEIPLMIV